MSENKATVPIVSDHGISWDDEADVVVVGYGIAGVAAAIGASESTDDVLVLERAGGSEGLCGGILYLGGGTPMQREMGWKDTPEQMFTFLNAALGAGTDQAKLRSYCSNSVAHYEWLVSCGVSLITGPDPSGSNLATPEEDGFIHVGGQEYAGGGLVWTGGEQAYPFAESMPPVPRGHIPRDPNQEEDLFEGAIIKAMFGASEKAGIRLRADTGVDRLIVGDSGRICGVAARTFGSEVKIRARRGVVLATGGFIYSDEMLRMHSPHLLTTGKFGHGGQDGLGIRMAQAVGAEAMHMDACDLTLTLYPPVSFGRGILINEHGQRFVNEDTYFGRLGAEVKFRQRGNAYLLLDEDVWVESSRRRPAWVGESVEEIEAEMGLPDGSLSGTVDYYNRYAEKGEDPLFHKASRWLKPLKPGYAVLDMREQPPIRAEGSHPVSGSRSPAVPGADFTMGAMTLGGLHTSVDGAVLTPSGEPIRGLFAAGRCTSGLATDGYCSGISLGDGSFFGRRAGQSAARSPE